MTIAIDGPVASGKTVVGRHVARTLGCRFLDTGAMYRAVTWVATMRGIELDDAESLIRLSNSLEMRLISSESGERLLANGEDVTDHLRDLEVDRGVSLVSKVSGVRSSMVAQQRTIAQEGPIVMVGRDIGTVVLTDAKVKVFLKASVDIRARRRLNELKETGQSPDYRQLVDDLLLRDKIDSERQDSPLRPANDAVQIDTDNLEITEVAERILSIVESR